MTHFTPPPLPAVKVTWKLLLVLSVTEFGLAVSTAAACVANADPTGTAARAVAMDTTTAPLMNLLNLIYPPLFLWARFSGPRFSRVETAGPRPAVSVRLPLPPVLMTSHPDLELHGVPLVRV